MNEWTEGGGGPEIISDYLWSISLYLETRSILCVGNLVRTILSSLSKFRRYALIGDFSPEFLISYIEKSVSQITHWVEVSISKENLLVPHLDLLNHLCHTGEKAVLAGIQYWLEDMWPYDFRCPRENQGRGWSQGFLSPRVSLLYTYAYLPVSLDVMVYMKWYVTSLSTIGVRQANRN